MGFIHYEHFSEALHNASCLENLYVHARISGPPIVANWSPIILPSLRCFRIQNPVFSGGVNLLLIPWRVPNLEWLDLNSERYTSPATVRQMIDHIAEHGQELFPILHQLALMDFDFSSISAHNLARALPSIQFLTIRGSEEEIMRMLLPIGAILWPHLEDITLENCQPRLLRELVHLRHARGFGLKNLTLLPGGMQLGNEVFLRQYVEISKT